MLQNNLNIMNRTTQQQLHIKTLINFCELFQEKRNARPARKYYKVKQLKS